MNNTMSGEMLNIKKYINDYDEEKVKKEFEENYSGKFCFALNSKNEYKIIVPVSFTAIPQLKVKRQLKLRL